MICSSCRRTLVSHLSSLQQTSPSLRSTTKKVRTLSARIRTIATVPSTNNASPSSPPPSTASNTSPAQATSTPGAAQPFSEPFFPSSTTAQSPPSSQGFPTPNASDPIKLTSSVAGGTPFTALQYVKQPSKPLVALEDHEYPDWLWTLLPSGSSADGSASELSGGVDVTTMTKKQRAKYERKQAKLAASLEKPVPLHEQSRDLLDEGEGSRAYVEKSRQLTRSMRDARRKEIREANFLKSM